MEECRAVRIAARRCRRLRLYEGAMYAKSAIAFSTPRQTHRLPRLFHEERGGFFRSPNLRADLRSLGEAADSLPRGPPPYSVWCLFSTQPIHTCDATSLAMLDDFCVPEQSVLGSTLRRLSARGHPFRTHGRLYAGAMRVSGTPGHAHLRLAASQQQPKQLAKLLRTCDLSPERHLLGERYSGLHKTSLLLFFQK